MGMREAINGKPMTVIGLISGIHSIIYGVGFLFSVGGFQETVLYRNIDMVGNPHVFGILILLAGLVVVGGLIANNCRAISWASMIQSLAWLFTFLAYALNGQILLGLAIALVWTVISFYVSYVHRNEDLVLSTILANKR